VVVEEWARRRRLPPLALQEEKVLPFLWAQVKKCRERRGLLPSKCKKKSVLPWLLLLVMLKEEEVEFYSCVYYNLRVY
jgi:hypothetical protein